MKSKIINLYNKYKMIFWYLVFGVLTTVVNIVVYFLLREICNVNYLISNAFAWFFSVLFAYVTNRKYVFESQSREILAEITKFFSSRLATGVLDMFLMWLLVSFTPINDLYIKIFVNVIVIILNYIFSKVFVFRER